MRFKECNAISGGWEWGKRVGCIAVFHRVSGMFWDLRILYLLYFHMIM